MTFQSSWSRLVAVLVRSHLDRRHGDGARRVLAHNTTTPSPRYAARALRSVSRYSMMRYARGTRVTGFENELFMNFRSPWRRLVAVLVRSHLDRRRGDGARGVLAHNTTTPSPRYAARAPRSVSRYYMV